MTFICDDDAEDSREVAFEFGLAAKYDECEVSSNTRVGRKQSGGAVQILASSLRLVGFWADGNVVAYPVPFSWFS
jgi:hypothetical protein